MTIFSIEVTKVRVKSGALPFTTMIVDATKPGFIVKEFQEWSSRQILDWCLEQGLQVVNLFWAPGNNNQPAFRGM